MKSIVPDDLVDGYVDKGVGIYNVEYLGELKQLKVENWKLADEIHSTLFTLSLQFNTNIKNAIFKQQKILKECSKGQRGPNRTPLI